VGVLSLHQGRQRGGRNIAGDTDTFARGAQQVAGQRRRRRLAVGARNRDHRCRQVRPQFPQAPGEEFDLADHGNALFACLRYYRQATRQTRRNCQQINLAQQARSELARHEFELKVGAGATAIQFAEVGRCRTRVGHTHTRALAQAPAGAGQAGFAEAENEDALALDFHYLIFKVDRPNSTSRMVMIQKRTTTWVSFHPVCSK